MLPRISQLSYLNQYIRMVNQKVVMAEAYYIKKKKQQAVLVHQFFVDIQQNFPPTFPYVYCNLFCCEFKKQCFCERELIIDARKHRQISLQCIKVNFFFFNVMISSFNSYHCSTSVKSFDSFGNVKSKKKNDQQRFDLQSRK